MTPSSNSSPGKSSSMSTVLFFRFFVFFLPVLRLFLIRFFPPPSMPSSATFCNRSFKARFPNADVATDISSSSKSEKDETVISESTLSSSDEASAVCFEVRNSFARLCLVIVFVVDLCFANRAFLEPRFLLRVAMDIPPWPIDDTSSASSEDFEIPFAMSDIGNKSSLLVNNVITEAWSAPFRFGFIRLSTTSLHCERAFECPNDPDSFGVSL